MGNTYDIFHMDPKLSEHKLMSIKFDKDTVFHDDDLKGTIYLNLLSDTPLSDIILTIKLSEGWVFTQGSDSIQSEKNELIVAQFALNIKQRLRINTALITLRSGEHSFPFLVRIPHFQPSFELPTIKYRGFIRYSLEAKTLSPQYTIQSEEKFFIQSQPLMVQTPLVLTSSVDINQLFFLSKGNTSLVALLSKNDFIYGENIPITITIDNTQGNIDFKQVKIRLMRKFSFHYKEIKNELSYEKILSHKYYPLECKCGEKNTQIISVLVKDEYQGEYTYAKLYNPYPKITNREILLPTVQTSILNCKYYLKVTGYFTSFVVYAKRPRVEFSISIVHQSFPKIKQSVTYIEPQSQIQPQPQYKTQPQPLYQQTIQFKPNQQQQQMLPQRQQQYLQTNNFLDQPNNNPYPNYPIESSNYPQYPNYPNNSQLIGNSIEPYSNNLPSPNMYEKPNSASCNTNNDYNVNDYPMMPLQAHELLPAMPSKTKNDFNP